MLNPSEINPLALPSVPLEDRRDLPTDPCIYFAIDGQGVVQYIGRAKNPRSRWQGHHRRSQLEEMGGVRIAYVQVDADLLGVVEAALINWFNPPLNLTLVPRPCRRALDSEALGYTHWRLGDLMAMHGISGSALAKELDLSVNAISALRNAETLPAIGGERLDQIAEALTNLSKMDGSVIRGVDLLEWVSVTD